MAFITPPFARGLRVDLVLSQEVVETDDSVVKGEELQAALVHGESERGRRLRRRSRQRTALKAAAGLNADGGGVFILIRSHLR